MRYITNEKGIGLLEVVASVVIITIILVIFSSVFLNSKKANIASEQVVDKTYAAQTAMEELYEPITSSEVYIINDPDQETFNFNTGAVKTSLNSTLYCVKEPHSATEIVIYKKKDQHQVECKNVGVEVKLLPFKEEESPGVEKQIKDLVRVITTVERENGGQVKMEALWRVK